MQAVAVDLVLILMGLACVSMLLGYGAAIIYGSHADDVESWYDDVH